MTDMTDMTDTTNRRPNIALFMTDEHRGDCLGIEGHPVLQTPYIDHLAASGVRFRRAYSACPVCVPARRTLMTGRKPASHGVLMNAVGWLDGPTLPGELSRAGYQTHLVGKLHLFPRRKLYGFDSAVWADSPGGSPGGDDYQLFLAREGVRTWDAGLAHGAHQNGWVARPWHLPEHLHFTHWCADQALEFLHRRDPTVPFFLKVSFHQPHQPCTPPQPYWDRYMAMDLPEPVVGDWARVYDGPVRGLPVTSWRTALEPELMRQYRAGYYGSINHVDDQIGRVLAALPPDTVIVFVSDHGEMLGDHQWIRKRNAFEGSARIPFLLRLPLEARWSSASGQVRDELVELMDLMPTLLDLAGADIPAAVEGRSLLPLILGEAETWRSFLHGECAIVPSLDSGMQYMTDGKRKYVWYPGTGKQHYFDLENDPHELRELSADPAHRPDIEDWRSRLVEELAGRPEGFVEDGRLRVTGGPAAPVMDWVRPVDEEFGRVELTPPTS